MDGEVKDMFGLDSCVQAPLRGTPRFHGAHGQIRLECCEGGVILRLRVRGLPCGACPDFYRLWVEGGCGCPPLALADVPAWRGEAALTCYVGGFAPENLVGRRAYLSMGEGRDGRVAEGALQPCRDCCYDEGPGCRDERPCRRTRPCRPAPPPCPPLYPDLMPRCCE